MEKKSKIRNNQRSKAGKVFLFQLKTYIKNNSGSIVLEALLSVPLFLIVSIIILTAINGLTMDILLGQAVDQTSGELGLYLPIISTGINSIEALTKQISQNNSAETKDTTEKIMTGLNKLSDYTGVNGQDIIGNLLVAKNVRNNIYHQYQKLRTNFIYGTIDIKDLAVFMDYNPKENVIWLRVYYQWDTIFGSYERILFSSVPIYGSLEFDATLSSNMENKDQIWLLKNFSRGKEFRQIFQANLGFNYPVIGKWEGGIATSIKSIDLTAPGYENNISGVKKIVEGYIKDVKNFQGTNAPWGKDGIWIQSQNIQKRVLILIIPANASEEQKILLSQLKNWAILQGVELQIEMYGNSYKYKSQNQNPAS